MKAGAAVGPTGKGYPGPNYSVNSTELDFVNLFGRVLLPQSGTILTHGDLNVQSPNNELMVRKLTPVFGSVGIIMLERCAVLDRLRMK